MKQVTWLLGASSKADPKIQKIFVLGFVYSTDILLLKCFS